MYVCYYNIRYIYLEIFLYIFFYLLKSHVIVFFSIKNTNKIMLVSIKLNKFEYLSNLVHEMGLEPTQTLVHRHLKPACLPIPPPMHTSIISKIFNFENIFLYLFSKKESLFAFYILFSSSPM